MSPSIHLCDRLKDIEESRRNLFLRLSGLAVGMAVAHIFGCGKAFCLSQLVSVDPDDSRINT